MFSQLCLVHILIEREFPQQTEHRKNTSLRSRKDSELSQTDYPPYTDVDLRNGCGVWCVHPFSGFAVSTFTGSLVTLNSSLWLVWCEQSLAATVSCIAKTGDCQMVTAET